MGHALLQHFTITQIFFWSVKLCLLFSKAYQPTLAFGNLQFISHDPLSSEVILNKIAAVFYLL